jgi:hypothetical protein
METLGKTRTLVIATVLFWLGAVLIGVVNSEALIRGAASLLALFATVTLWSLWALNEYGISIDGTPTEKPKRDVDSGEDARLSLLLSMLTPDERDALKSRLVDDLSGDGEIVSLADMLAEQKPDDMHTGQSS